MSGKRLAKQVAHVRVVAEAFEAAAGEEVLESPAVEDELFVQDFHFGHSVQDEFHEEGHICSRHLVAFDELAEAGYLLEAFEELLIGLAMEEVNGVAAGEPGFYDAIGVFFLASAETGRVREVLEEGLFDGLADKAEGYAVGAFLFTFVHHFDLSDDGGDDAPEVRDAGDSGGFAVEEHAALGGGIEVFIGGDGEAGADAAAFVHVLAVAGGEGDFFDEVFEEVGHAHSLLLGGGDAGFLFGNSAPDFDGGRIMSGYLAFDAVFERSDDAAAVGVVFGIGSEHEHDVYGEAEFEAADLHVAFLEDVEECHLDAGLEVGQFVDDEEAAVCAWDEAEVDDALIGIREAEVGGFDGVYVAHEVCDADIWGGEFFDVSLVAVEPFDGSFVAAFGDEVAGVAADGSEWVVVEFAAGHYGDVFIEEVDQQTSQTGFGLAAQTQKQDVVPTEDGALNVGDNGVIEAVDAGQGVFATSDFFQQILA